MPQHRVGDRDRQLGDPDSEHGIVHINDPGDDPATVPIRCSQYVEVVQVVMHDTGRKKAEYRRGAVKPFHQFGNRTPIVLKQSDDHWH